MSDLQVVRRVFRSAVRKCSGTTKTRFLCRLWNLFPCLGLGVFAPRLASSFRPRALPCGAAGVSPAGRRLRIRTVPLARRNPVLASAKES